METSHRSSTGAPTPEDALPSEVAPESGSPAGNPADGVPPDGVSPDLAASIFPDGSPEAVHEEPADLNLIFPDSEQDLNALFPEREYRELLEKVHKSKRDIDRMNGRLVEDPERVVPHDPEEDAAAED